MGRPVCGSASQMYKPGRLGRRWSRPSARPTAIDRMTLTAMARLEHQPSGWRALSGRHGSPPCLYETMGCSCSHTSLTRGHEQANGLKCMCHPTRMRRTIRTDLI
jgi:hypothetical protein